MSRKCSEMLYQYCRSSTPKKPSQSESRHLQRAHSSTFECIIYLSIIVNSHIGQEISGIRSVS